MKMMNVMKVTIVWPLIYTSDEIYDESRNLLRVWEMFCRGREGYAFLSVSLSNGRSFVTFVNFIISLSFSYSICARELAQAQESHR